MKLEGAPQPEKKRPVFTKEEWKEFANRSVDDPELHAWMEQKGIVFGNGMIEVELDGEVGKMDTNREDFGTFAE